VRQCSHKVPVDGPNREIGRLGVVLQASLATSVVIGVRGCGPWMRDPPALCAQHRNNTSWPFPEDQHQNNTDKMAL
jgi:hypothetical protein